MSDDRVLANIMRRIINRENYDEMDSPYVDFGTKWEAGYITVDGTFNLTEAELAEVSAAEGEEQS